MGRFNKGMLGPVSGAVGPVVGSSWKDVIYMKSKPLIKKRTSTADQLDHQAKFSVVINFVNVFTALMQLTFKKYAVGMSQNNAAVAYNYKNAITGKNLNYSIDFTKALVSRGELPNATAPSASVSQNNVYFKWTDNSQVTGATPQDKAILVAFCPNLNQSIFSTGDSIRSSASGILDVTPFAGEQIETWIAFVSSLDNEVASNSNYTGKLTVS